MTRKFALLALIAPIAIAGCQSTAYDGGAPKLIARNVDSAWGDPQGPRDGNAAVAVLPNCTQAWITDEGLEGYGTLRYDPKSGLPVCSTEIPAGSVIGDHRASADLPDILP